MTPVVRYFAVTDDDDPATHLGRVVTNAAGVFGYLLHEGEWIEERSILHCLFDPPVGEEVGESEARRLVERFGGRL